MKQIPCMGQPLIAYVRYMRDKPKISHYYFPNAPTIILKECVL